MFIFSQSFLKPLEESSAGHDSHAPIMVNQDAEKGGNSVKLTSAGGSKKSAKLARGLAVMTAMLQGMCPALALSPAQLQGWITHHNGY